MLNTIIGIVALIVAIGSYIYTWSLNRYKLDIIDLQSHEIFGRTRINFSIQNTSSRPIKLDNVELYLEDELIKDNGFNAVKFEEAYINQQAKKYESEHTSNLMGISMSPLSNPYTYSMPDYDNDSFPFDKPEYISAGSSKDFSYFVDKLPRKIVLHSKSLSFLSKHQKSFIVRFDK